MVVTGCLAQRYKQEIIDEIPEVDVVLGTTSYDKIVEAVEEALEGKSEVEPVSYTHLVGRGTETMDVIEFRMNRAKEEALEMDQYDYLIINDDLQECVEEMHQIIQGEHRRSFRNAEFIEHMKEELKGE